MVDAFQVVHALGGMVRKAQLVEHGVTERGLTAAVRRGDLIRVRNGWYSSLDESSPEVRAVRVGGRLTGVSALRMLGAWVDPSRVLHVSMKRTDSRTRSQWSVRKPKRSGDGVQLHWDAEGIARRGSATSVSVEDALWRVVHDEPLEVAVAALDWAVHCGVMDRFEFELFILTLPARLRPISMWVDPDCGSMPESFSRTRFRLRGLAVRSQVPVAGTKSIDLLVEESVAFEVDGATHHRDRFDSDRVKDLDIYLVGYHAMRPSARLVFEEWPSLLWAVELALEARGIRASAPHPKLPRPTRRRNSRQVGNAGIREDPA